MIIKHLPVLVVIIPLLSAPVCLLLNSIRWARIVSLSASMCSLIIATILLNQVGMEGVISYSLGGWPAPWGIEYRLDWVNAFVLLIVSGISTIVLLFASRSVLKEIASDRIILFYTAYLLCFAGLLGMTVTGDAFNLFVFMEITSLASYSLISLGRDRLALVASYQYLIMGSIGATFILVGIGLLFIMTGTLNMQDLAVRIPAVSDTRTLQSAFAFLIVGICLKMALFPLHQWLPNAYSYAPSVVTALLSATATKVAVYILLRFVFSIFGVQYSFDVMSLDVLLLPLAVVAILFASMTAFVQDNIKRMLAYSSIAQIGYMLLGVSFASTTGLTATILHLFNHALMKSALFLSLGCIAYRFGSVQFSTFRGLGRTMPWTMSAFVLGGLSLIGVPLTVGFISKWYLILAAIQGGWWPLVVVVVGGSLLTAIYIWRVVEQAYFHNPPEQHKEVHEAPLSLLLPTWLLIIANLYFGIATNFSISVAQQAALLLLGANSE